MLFGFGFFRCASHIGAINASIGTLSDDLDVAVFVMGFV